MEGKNSLGRLKLRQGGKRTLKPEDMPLVFLDFDGVLNNWGSATAFGTFHTFDPVSVSLMRRLCEQSGAKVAVSSSWRPQAPGQLDLLLRSMQRAGAGELVGFVIGYTDRLLGIRGAEVAKFRRDNRHSGKFVILDDDSDFFPGQPLIQTSQGRGFGLCEYVRALEILYPLHEDLMELKPYVGMKLGGQREGGYSSEQFPARSA
jgi:HAD domain in Swiss Army Knife RNA repair proteins